MAGLTKKSQKLLSLINNLFGQFGPMTVRQVYYQLVPLGYKYRQVAYILGVGRKLGLINLDNIVDRSRPAYGLNVWSTPSDILNAAADNYKLDYWENEPRRVEVWSEKDALSQIMNKVAGYYRVPVRVTRGYPSTSNKIAWSQDGLIVLYFGDFDPSGLSIDLELAENQFLTGVQFKRISLTQPQVEHHDLPFVKVKMDDPRAKEYVKLYGKKGYELDALNPNALRELIKTSIEAHITFDLEQKQREEREHRLVLSKYANMEASK